jgi:pimeloyl-ACP methyl ester carboxylesterase
MTHFKDVKDEDMKNIKAPALIVSGDHDVVVPEHTVKMSQVIPHAQLAIFPGDHSSVIGEVCTTKKDSKMPELVASLIKEFINE